MIGNLIGVAISGSENSCFVGVQVNECCDGVRKGFLILIIIHIHQHTQLIFLRLVPPNRLRIGLQFLLDYTRICLTENGFNI